MTMDMSKRGPLQMVGHTLSATPTQYFEKAGLLDLFTVCGGTNVCTFVPDEGSQTLTPKVRSTY